MAIIINAKQDKPFVVKGTYLHLEQVYARIEILMEADGSHTNCALYFWQDQEAYDRQPTKPMCLMETDEDGKEIDLGFERNYEFVLDLEAGQMQNLAVMTDMVSKEIGTKGYEFEVQAMYKGIEGKEFDRNPIGAKDGEFPPDVVVGDIDTIKKQIEVYETSLNSLQVALAEAEKKADEEEKAKAEAEAEAQADAEAKAKEEEEKAKAEAEAQAEADKKAKEEEEKAKAETEAKAEEEAKAKAEAEAEDSGDDEEPSEEA